jgi:hypothetical protein
LETCRVWLPEDTFLRSLPGIKTPSTTTSLLDTPGWMVDLSSTYPISMGSNGIQCPEKSVFGVWQCMLSFLHVWLNVTKMMDKLRWKTPAVWSSHWNAGQAHLMRECSGVDENGLLPNSKWLNSRSWSPTLKEWSKCWDPTGPQKSTVPSGKLRFYYGKSHFVHGKTHYKWSCSIVMKLPEGTLW